MSSVTGSKRIAVAGRFLFLAWLIGLAVSVDVRSASAATDGALANTSTGTANQTLVIPKLIKIIHMGDITLGPYSGSGVLEANQNVAISVNIRAAASRLYRVTATGSCAGNSPAGAFNVSNGTVLLPYSVFFNDVTGTAGEVALTAGVASATQSAANFPLTATTDNANYHVQFSQTALQAAPDGTFTGTLSLVVTPQ